MSEKSLLKMESLYNLQYDARLRIEKAIANYKKSPKARITSSYIQARLDSLDSTWTSLTQVHEKIVQNKTESNAVDKYFTDDFFGVIEELYIDHKSELKEILISFSESKVSTDGPIENLNRDRCLEAGCLDHIVHFLKYGNHTQVKKAAQATAHILIGTPNNIQQALDRGILDALVPALTNGNDECKVQSALVITYLCAHGSAPQLRMLTVSAALQPYCWLVAAGGEVSCDVLGGLTNLMQKVDQNTQPDLRLRLTEIDVPQILKTVQKDGDKRILKLAKDLLQTYFNDDQ